MIAEAAQRYGIFIRDMLGKIHSSPRTRPPRQNPYTGPTATSKASTPTSCWPVPLEPAAAAEDGTAQTP